MWGIVIAVVLAIAWIALRANYEYRQLEARLMPHQCPD